MLPAPCFLSQSGERGTGFSASGGRFSDRWLASFQSLPPASSRPSMHAPAAPGKSVCKLQTQVHSRNALQSRFAHPPRQRSVAQVNGPLEAEPIEAVVIVDHGSRRAESNNTLHEFAEIYRYALHTKPLARRWGAAPQGGITHLCVGWQCCAYTTWSMRVSC